MGGKYQVETEAGLFRKGDFPCRRAGGMTSFVLSFQPLMVNTYYFYTPIVRFNDLKQSRAFQLRLMGTI